MATYLIYFQLVYFVCLFIVLETILGFLESVSVLELSLILGSILFILIIRI